MAAVIQAKTRRSTARCRVTKQVRATEKLLSDDVREIPTEDLKRKLELFKVAVQEELVAQDQLLNAMAVEGVSEDDLQKEIEANSVIEDSYEDHTEKMTSAINMGSHFLLYQELKHTADSWLAHGVPSSTDFPSSGAKLVESFQKLIRSLTPLSAHATFGKLLTDAQSQLEQIQITLNKKAPAMAASSTTAEATPPVRKPAPYHVKAPTFSGKAIDFPHFQERFTEVIKTHWDAYSDGDRCCILSESMIDPAAKELVDSYSSAGYDTALQQLKERYGRSSAIYPKYVEELVTRHRYEYSQDSMSHILKRVEHTLEAMAKINGKTIEQFAVALVVRDFDEELSKEWAKHLGSSDVIPDSKMLLDFVRPLSHNLPSKPSKSSASHHIKSTIKKEDSSSKKVAVTPSPAAHKTCLICKGNNHSLTRCQVFLDSDLNQRWALIRQHKYCANCLHQSHQISNCASSFTCKECKARHHTLLHRSDDTSGGKTKQSGITLMTSSKSKPSASQKANNPRRLKGASIRTALCTVYNEARCITVRAAVDTCSTHSIITERVASHLEVHRFPLSVDMKGPVSTVHLSRGATVEVGPAFPSPDKVKLDAAITTLSFSSTPPDGIDELLKLPLLQGVRLADSELGGPIDLILGTYDQSDFLTSEPTRFLRDKHITVAPTTLGWTVTAPTSGKDSVTMYTVELQDNPLDKQLVRMWQLEQVPSTPQCSPEEESALTQFHQTLQIRPDGRYSVSLPRVVQPPSLGKSLKMATSRFLSNERSLKRKGKLQAFNTEVAAYLELGHAEVVPEDQLDLDHYYLPVHGVFKDHSTTTKVRPVFDGSARSSSGASLNDLLLPGPNLYPRIEDILINFRLHLIAFSADISKMFREILLNPSEYDLHRFLTRNASGTIVSLRMTRLTFGIKSSPFLASQVLLHLAERFKDSHPLAWQCINQSFYVDDLLSGAEDLDGATAKRQQICSLLAKAGMIIRKWRSNNDSFKSTIPTELIETADLDIPAAKDSSKALGIHWAVSTDCLHVAAPELPQTTSVTKRLISSVSAQIFDILGFFAPYIITAKALLQELWILKLGWDDDVPESLQQRWMTWVSDLPLVTSHLINRRYFDSNARTVSSSLHGFSDASEVAYGAVVYLRSVFADGTVSCSLVIARARVRPLKLTTIPKMELQAAALLAQLLVYVSNTLHISISQVQPWTDSSIVLSWLRKPPHSISEVFVRNRISAIQDSLPESLWRHVPSKSNPADIASRGCSVPELLTSTLWWSGPSWLSCPESSWPATAATPLPRNLPGVKATVLTTALLPVEEWGFWLQYSSYTTLTRTYSWIRRFIINCRTSPVANKLPTLTSKELSATRDALLLKQQLDSFPDVFQLLRKKQTVPGHHCLDGMVVYLKEHEHAREDFLPASHFIKVTGRVRKEAATHPRELTPLSLKHALTRLLVETEHYKHQHPGISTLISILGHAYFIPGLRSFLKRLSKRCATCRRANAQPIAQQMGLLPSVRTTPSPPFTSVGVDFAGPFQLKMGYTRKPVMFKAYCCLFICLSSKAVHLEVCTSLETEEFLAAFQRFCDRRGTPHSVYSDNGSNFVGAKAELQAIRRMLQHSEGAISHISSTKELQWHTIPPRSPHHGGLWEAAVREMKRLLRKQVAPHPLRLDEF